MTAVLVMGDLPSTGVLGAAAAERIRPSPEGPAIQESVFLDIVQARLREHGAVVVVYPAWRAESYTRLVRLARTGLASDRIAGIPLGLPPLALTLVADTLAFLAPYVAPGLLSSVAHRLPSELIAGAWVRSVAGLEHIDIPLKAHLASYLPGGFLVIAAPRPGVHRLSGQRQVVDLGRRPTDPVLLLVADSGGDVHWVQRHLAPALRPSGMTNTQAPPLGPAFWGTQKYIEFVAFSGHPEALSQIVRSLDCHPCPWCGEPTNTPACAFCGMTQRPTPAAAPPAMAPQPEPPHPGDVRVAPGRPGAG